MLQNDPTHLKRAAVNSLLFFKEEKIFQDYPPPSVYLLKSARRCLKRVVQSVPPPAMDRVKTAQP